MRMKYALFLLAPLALISQTAAQALGTASFSPVINWQYSPNLYFNVNGGPANTCGDLYASRNGAAWTVTYGWLCTDGSGNATKGPWTWANQNGDEDAYAYIGWPGGTSTNTAHHIWDKTAPSITINSFTNAPPTSFTGSASDGSYGSGFKSDFGSESGVGYSTGSQCFIQFRNVSTGYYWCPGNNVYSSSTACSISCTISGMPSRNVTWSASQVPPGYTHNPLETYQWKIIIYDNYQLGHRAEKTVIIPTI
jgi:hypothetical protein